MDWRELQDMVNTMQTGTLPEDELNDIGGPGIPPSIDSEYSKNLLAKYGLGNKSIAQQQAELDAIAGAEREADWSAIRDAYGYGEDRRDWQTPIDEWIENPTDYRAKSQTQAGKFINGAIKAIPTAFTTYADNTVGLLASLLGYTPVGTLLGKDAEFVSTGFSESMQALRDKMEEIFPNYRTEQEIADENQWWKHLNGNFWGDVFLKNLGFTFGAGASAKTFAKGFQLAQGKVVNQAYKAAVTAAAKGENELEAFRRVLQGAAVEDIPKLYRDFNKIARNFRNLGWQSQLLGSVGGAIGESRTEAINAAKEFRDEQLAEAINYYQDAKENLAQELMDNSDFWMKRPVYDGYGNVIGEEDVLSPEGEAYRDRELQRIQGEYESTNAMIDRESERLANHTFWLNMPLLAGSNAVMFGKMLSGGFKSQLGRRVRGKMGELQGVGSTARAIGMGVRNVLTEGMEELSQKVFSEGQKDISRQNMAAFHNDQYDTEAIHSVADWILSMMDSAGNVIGKGQSWEEFAIGALTGGLGHVANFSRTPGSKFTSLKDWKWEPVGGIYGGIKEGLNQRNENRRLAEELNNRYNDPEFKNLWSGMVRHKHYDDVMDQSLQANNKFVWKTAEEKQMINDVIMFANAGKLNELEGYVDAFTKLSDDDIANFRELFSDETDNEFQNKTDDDIRNWLNERVQEVKKTIQQYRDFYDSIDLLSFGTSDKKAIEELVFTASQLENFEERYKKLAEEVWSRIEPTVQDVAKKRNKKGEPTDDAKMAQSLLESSDDARMLFGGIAMDVTGREVNDKHDIAALLSKYQDDAKRQKVLKTLEDWGAFAKDPSLKDDVEDLQNLVKARQSYYAKLFAPYNRKNMDESFSDDASDPDKEAEKLRKSEIMKRAAEDVQKLAAAKDLKDYIRILQGLEDVDDETNNEFYRQISENPILQSYEDTISKAEKFRKSISTEASRLMEGADDKQAGLLKMIENAALKENVYMILSTSDDNDSPEVAVGRAILNALMGNEAASKEARKILEQLLGDVARSAGLGTIKKETYEVPSVDIKETGSGGGDGSGGGNADAVTVATAYIDSITDFKDNNLNAVANGDVSVLNINRDDISDTDYAKIVALAAAKIKSLKAASGMFATEDGSGDSNVDDDSDDSPSKRLYNQRKDTSISGTPDPFYSTYEGKRGRKKPYNSQDIKTQAKLEWMVNHKVNEFIDSGALARLWSYWSRKGEQLPIRIIANPHYKKNNLESNPFVVKRDAAQNVFHIAPTAVLAVEIDEETRKVLAPFFDPNTGFMTDDSLVSVEDGGVTTQYQVIGWFDTKPNAAYNLDSNNTDKLPEVEKRSRLIWEHAINRSIIPQYSEDLNNSVEFTDEGKWYVAHLPGAADTEGNTSKGERIAVTLNYIMPGRKLLPKPLNEGDKYTKFPLLQSLKQYKDYGGRTHFALVTREQTYMTANAPDFSQLEHGAPMGSLWMATQNANGTWSWTYLTIATANEFDWEGNKDSDIVTKFRKAIEEKILAPTKATREENQRVMEDRIRGTRELDEMFYLGHGNTFSVAFENGEPVLLIAGVPAHSVDDAIRILKERKVRFQIGVEAVEDRELKTITEFINTGVLSSEMESFVRFNANIGIDFMDDTDADGNPIDLQSMHQDNNAVAIDFNEEVVASGGRIENSIRVGRYGYTIKDGNVYLIGNDSPIEDMVLIAQVKVLDELIRLRENNRLDEFNGEHLEFSLEGKSHTDLYEKEVGGVTVRVRRLGSEGDKFFLVNDNIWWDAFSEAAREQMKERAAASTRQPQREMTPGEEREILDKEFEERTGGKINPPKKKERKPRRGKKPRTAQDIEIKQIEEENELDCD